MDKAPATCVERPQEPSAPGTVQGGLGLRRNVSLLWPPLQPLYYGAWQKALEEGVLGGQCWVSLAGSLFNQEQTGSQPLNVKALRGPAGSGEATKLCPLPEAPG